jgi:hypothetical protein
VSQQAAARQPSPAQSDANGASSATSEIVLRNPYGPTHD